MCAFDFLDVESDFLDPVLNVEVEKPVRIIERTLCQHCDHVECEIIILQQTYRAHRPFICSMPAARAPAGVVEVCRTIDTEPDPRSRSDKEPRPIVVKE